MITSKHVNSYKSSTMKHKDGNISPKMTIVKANPYQASKPMTANLSKEKLSERLAKLEKVCHYIDISRIIKKFK